MCLAGEAPVQNTASIICRGASDSNTQNRKWETRNAQIDSTYGAETVCDRVRRNNGDERVPVCWARRMHERHRDVC